MSNSPSTLLLRLSAPLQAWGSGSRFANRRTDTQPTKSGVIGMLAAALGRGREDDLTDLRTLYFGVRTDQMGTLVRDFQTAVHHQTLAQMPLSERWYLGDARFVAGIEGPRQKLEELAHALQNPVFPLYLGRRSCPPAEPVYMSIVDTPLENALQEAPWEAADWYRTKKKLINAGEEVELSIMRDAREGELAHDLTLTAPVSYSPIYRRYSHQPVVYELTRVQNAINRDSVKQTKPSGIQEAIFAELEDGES